MSPAAGGADGSGDGAVAGAGGAGERPAVAGGGDRKEQEVRRLLAAAARPRVPPDLLPRALARGHRARRRARWRRRLLWLVLTAAAVAFTVWAWTAEPWVAPPMRTTPPLEPW
ncbi:hypothetical protein [Streptomyces sp. DH12]|uniref:hypothetical protein n=1 Tax=Streptomyces sp. DH12 TaxID=2857010 RepID=UPI0027D2831E|nr:hypothetical protein [Streptomyces sp. DH12]